MSWNCVPPSLSAIGREEIHALRVIEEAFLRKLCRDVLLQGSSHGSLGNVLCVAVGPSDS